MAEHLDQELAEDLGRLMYALTTKYKGHERALGLAMTRSLALFIAISTKDTADALDAAARVLRETPFNEIRREHFSYSLGVDKPIVKAKVPGDLLHLVPQPKDRKPDDDGQTA